TVQTRQANDRMTKWRSSAMQSGWHLTRVSRRRSWTQEKRKRPFRLGRHKTDRRSGVLCHIGVTAYVRESGR
ncbi:hypothetical protein, partial [Bacillus sp. Hm123]|uniref:hypothetical protein n=1 Tax=Bacillus sp. Hm123 TaxID=3450745 RepID=UPI003F433BB5